MIKNCVVCEKEFEAYGNACYCSKECARKHKSEYMKHYMRIHRRNNPMPKKSNEPTAKLCPEDCKYISRLHGNTLPVCDYILITGVPRGEEPREGGCSKYQV